MKEKLIGAIVILFALIGAIVCAPALLIILIPIAILLCLLSPIICLIQKGKIRRLEIKISKAEDKK